MQAIRKHLTYANVMATMAVFLALGGSAWALSKHSVGARQLKKNAVTSAKLKKGAVTKAKIAKGAVNGAKIADASIGIGDVSASLHLLCRSGTSYLQGACIQDSPGSDTFANAMSSCRAAGGRLPSPSELLTLVARGVTIVHPTTTFEFTDSVSFDGTNQRDEEVDMGGSGAVSNALIGGSPHPYRCVFDPTG